LIDASGQILQAVEHHGPRLALEQARVGRRALDDRPARREVAEQSRQSAAALERIFTAANDAAIDVSGPAPQPFTQRLTADRYAIQLEQVFQLAQQRLHAAGGVEVLHV